jgi:hypothetical protein
MGSSRRRRTLSATSHTASSTTPTVPVHVHASVAPVNASTGVAVSNTVLRTAENPITNPCALTVRMTDLPGAEPLVHQG